MAGDQGSRENLEASIDEAEWSWLREHAKRDVVIVVSNALALADAGEAVAKDDTARVEAWIRSGALAKPTREQIAAWEATPAKRFLTLVLRPYVLIQDRPLH